MRATTITHLPNELLIMIIKDTALSHTDLLHLRAVDRKFRNLASPHAFRVVNVRYTPASAWALVDLLDLPTVAECVEEISCEQKEESAPIGEKFDDDEDEHIISTYTNVLSALHLFPNLKSLSFSFVMVIFYMHDAWLDDYEQSYFKFQWAVLQALSRNTLPHPSLTSLTLQNLLPHHQESLYADPAFAALIGSLRHLRMLVLTGDTHEGFDEIEVEVYQDYWQTISTHVLQPAISLRSLAFGEDDITCRMPHINFNLVHCPHLESLSLTNMHFDRDEGGSPLIGTEAFIVRHKDTLTALELDRCVIEVQEDENPAKTWANVWGRLARELGGLRELKVRFEEVELDDLEDDDPWMGYVMSVEGIWFKHVDLIGEGKDRDSAAFGALVEVVRTRARGEA